MSGRAPRLTATLAAVAVSTALLCSCGSGAGSRGANAGAPSSSAPSGPPGRDPGAAGATGPYWLVQDFTLALLERNGLPVSTITAIFNSPRTLLIVRPHGSAPDALVPRATKVETFDSSAALQAAFRDSTIEPGVSYVLYDNEAWALTPGGEQAAPFASSAGALAFAHAHGLRMIFAPAANLSTVLSPGYSASDQLTSGGGKYSGYLDLNLAGRGAGVSDILEIQGQQAEDQPGFAAFVQRAVGQARAAAPTHPVLLGLTTAIPGARGGQPGHPDGCRGRDTITRGRLLAERSRDVTTVPGLRSHRRRPCRVVPRVVRRRLGRLAGRRGRVRPDHPLERPAGSAEPSA